MRFFNKYKHFTNTTLFLKDCFFRVLKFKRSKWKKLQSNLKIEKKKTKLFGNHFLSQVSYKHWDKMKLHYKESLVLKRAVFRFFDDSLSIKYYKQVLKTKKPNLPLILPMLLKPLFKVDILLWKLSFFESAYQARQAIQNGLILVNNAVLDSCIHLNCGDILTFVTPKKFVFNSIIKHSFLFSFLEIDYYSGSIVILKNFKDLNINSITACSLNLVNTQRFNNYIRTK